MSNQEFCKFATVKDDGTNHPVVICNAVGLECEHQGYHSIPFKSCLVYIAMSRPAGYDTKKEFKEYMKEYIKWVEDTVKERENSIEDEL